MSIKSHVGNLSNYEFLDYCETIKLENLGLLFNSAVARLKDIEKYGCNDCTVCDDRSDEPAIILDQIEKGLRCTE